MKSSLNDDFPTPFQQIFATYCVLMAEICILLFSSNLASKSQQLLITNSAPIFRKSKRNQVKTFLLWRYSDTRFSLRSKLYYKNNDSFQPLQTFAMQAFRAHSAIVPHFPIQRDALKSELYAWGKASECHQNPSKNRLSGQLPRCFSLP
jgi:hypothetical protein